MQLSQIGLLLLQEHIEMIQWEIFISVSPCNPSDHKQNQQTTLILFEH